MSPPWGQVAAGTPGGTLLRRAWQPVYRDVDLRPGAVVGLTVLGERWTLFRADDGRVGLVASACPHRGTRLDLGRVRDGAVVCMHHGWAFDPAGHCLSRPDGGPCAVSVRAAPVAVHLGLVFAWLGDGPPPPLPRWPAFEQPGTLRVLPPETWPCPFFLRLENSCDLGHLPVAHATSGVGEVLGDPTAAVLSDLPDGLSIDGEARVPLRVRVLLPNALAFPTPVSETAGWRDHLVWRVPVDDDRCVSFVVTHVPASVPDHAAHAFGSPLDQPLAPTAVARLGEAVLAGQARLADLDTDSLTEVEDYVALCGVLRDETGAPAAGEALGPWDGPVRALRRRWQAALRGDARVWSGPPAG
ncbi:MAG: Rieske 2Fe-2S domain-containing protein [Alphaproteobacteria bacterium]|nr:Rieske 2Fe-2S domain-containing protein [Alphaproteobacteria bacterium]